MALPAPGLRKKWTAAPLVLAILACLFAAQLHGWAEAVSNLQDPGHQCEFCLSGHWAVPTAPVTIVFVAVPLRSERLRIHLVLRDADVRQDGSRAPPIA